LKKTIYTLLFIINCSLLSAQELNCKVQVILNANTTSINQKVFKTLEKSISDFMNLRKWTDETTAPHQKINCYLTINITDASKENAYGADFTIQSERPVFNSTYSTPLLRHRDKSVHLEYIENQAIDYADNTFFSNLSATLAFYAHFVIAMDNETFSMKGGQTSLDKCQSICNLVPQNLSVAGSAVKGWQANEAQDISGQQTRIGVILATLNGGNDKFRNAIYKYHINGIDVMESDSKKALEEIELAIKDIYEIPSKHYIHKHFVLTKVDEIINLFAKESASRKKKIGEMLVNIDPTIVDKVNKGLY
jgi:Domain of unknown function (DUF4835)